MILKLICRSAVVLVAFMSAATQSYAFEASFSVGHYEPTEGVVNGLYYTKTAAYQLGIAVPRADGLSWSSTLFYHSFESRVANLENGVRLFALSSGFRKKFSDRESIPGIGIEPFFGLGGGAASLYVKPENELTETTYSEKALHGFAYSWEIGVAVSRLWTDRFDLELKMTDLAIGRKLFGNLNIGGRILSFGTGYHF